jgi:quinol monooxygenase YgiN
MHAMVRKYAGKDGLLDGVAPKVRDGLVPLLRQAPGFRSYCCFASEDGHLVSVSVFDDRATADAANAKVREWVAANLRDALPDPPEVLAGEVRRQLSGQAQGGAEGAYVVIRQYDGVRSIERLTALADEHVLPVIRQAPGLWGHYTFTSGQDQGRVVAVSVFEGRENAMRVSERVVGIMREKARELAREPPRVTAGEAVVAVTA